MTVPAASLSARNRRLSVHRFLRDGWAAPLSLEVSWADPSADPDRAASGVGAAPPDSWAAVSWSSGTAAHKGADVLQVDLYSRVSADQLGAAVYAALGALEAALRPGRIPLYDFSAVAEAGDEEVPVPGNVILVQSEAGVLGAASGIVGPLAEAGRWRATVSYRIRLLSDAARGRYH